MIRQFDRQTEGLVGVGGSTHLPTPSSPTRTLTHTHTHTHTHSRHWCAVPLFTAVMLGLYSVARHPPGVFTDTSQREPPRYPAPLSATQHRPNCKHWFSTSWTEGRRVREGRAWSVQPQAGLLRNVLSLRHVSSLSWQNVSNLMHRGDKTCRNTGQSQYWVSQLTLHARSRRKVLLYQPTNLTQIREVTVPVHLFSEEAKTKQKNKKKVREPARRNS